MDSINMVELQVAFSENEVILRQKSLLKDEEPTYTRLPKKTAVDIALTILQTYSQEAAKQVAEKYYKTK